MAKQQTINKVNGYIANPVGAALGELNQNDGGTIWNHQGYEQYQNASLTEQANQNVGTGLDPFGMVAGLWNDITGTTAQSREFAQQEYLQDKMNEYNSPVQQMARMKAAGINPNLAASGIAGSGNESAQVPSVASNAGGVANGVGQLAGAAGALAGGVGALAGAKETMSLLAAKKANLIQDTALKLSQSGLNIWQARSVATSLYYMPFEKQADIYLKLANLDNLRQQYKNLEVEHDNILWEIDQRKGSVALMETEAARNTEDARFKKAQNDFFELHGFYPTDPNDVAIRNSIVLGDRVQAEQVGEAIYDYSYKSSIGQYSAEAEKAYEIELNRTKGKEESEKEYRENRQWFIEHEAQVKAYWDFMYKLPANIRQYLLKGTMKQFSLYGGNGGAPPMPTPLQK